MMARASTSGSTEIRCTYQPIASASSLSDAHIRAKVRVSADSSSGGSWCWSVPVRLSFCSSFDYCTACPSKDRSGDGTRAAMIGTSVPLTIRVRLQQRGDHQVTCPGTPEHLSWAMKPSLFRHLTQRVDSIRIRAFTCPADQPHAFVVIMPADT